MKHVVWALQTIKAKVAITLLDLLCRVATHAPDFSNVADLFKTFDSISYFYSARENLGSLLNERYLFP